MDRSSMRIVHVVRVMLEEFMWLVGPVLVEKRIICLVSAGLIRKRAAIIIRGIAFWVCIVEVGHEQMMCP